MNHAAEDQDLLESFCPACHYSLRGIQSDRCPECGGFIADILAGKSRIPWVNRHEIGLFRAFWRTAWMGTFRVDALCADSGGPRAYVDAQRFRWMVFAHAGPSTVAGFILTGCGNVPGWDWGVAAGAAIGLLLFFALLTGVQTYFFHPRWMPIPLQNRILALSYYLCAEFAWLPLIALLIWLTFAVPHRQNDVTLGLQIGAVLLPFALALGWYFGVTRAAWKLTRRVGRVWAVVVLLPLVTVVLFLNFVVGPPAVVAYIRILIASFAD